MEKVVHPEFATVEELLAKRILLSFCACVVLVKGGLDDLRLEAHFLCQFCTRLDALHEATANIVLAMPFNLLRSLAIEDKADGELAGAEYPLLRGKR